MRRVQPQGHAGQQRALPIGVWRAVERLQQLLQFGDLGAGPDAALTERDRLDAGGPQGFQHPAGLAVAAHQHGDMPRAQRRAVEPVALRGVQAPRDVLGQLAQQQCADLGLRALAPGPQLQGGARLRFFERRFGLAAGLHRQVGQTGLQEGLGLAPEQAVERLQQLGGGALVVLQGPDRLGLVACAQVGRQVGLAELVDGLLRVADQEATGRQFLPAA